MRAVLIGSSGLVLGREYALDAPVVTIGRRDENVIVIKDPTVSRKHGEILRDGDSLYIVDKGSTSGITVNGQLITGQHPLRDGDRIGIGSSAVFLIQMQMAEDKTIAFSQQDYNEQGRTQFITREIGDPRAVPIAPESAPAPAPEIRRASETLIQNTPFAPAPPPAPSRPEPVAPPPAAPVFSPPPQASAPPPSFPPPPSAPSWNEPTRVEPPLPDFGSSRPSVDLGEPSYPQQTMPDMPRAQSDYGLPPGLNQPPQSDFGAPRFDAPPPPMSAVSEFAPSGQSNPNNPMIGGPAPYSPQPDFSQAPPPSFSSPPPPMAPPMGMNQPPIGMNAPGAMMAPPPPPAKSGGRSGLVVALIVVVILVLIAVVVIGLLLTGKLG
ncbi:MAG: FHA domain-containing protein [Thermomicrobiales bacterium]